MVSCLFRLLRFSAYIEELFMYLSRSWHLVLAVLCLISFQSSSPARAYADTYQVFQLATDSYNFAGMDDLGHVSFNSGVAYVNYTNGLFAGTSSSAPGFLSDQGRTSTCPSAPSGAVVLRTVCNGSRYAFDGWLSAAQQGVTPAFLYDDSFPPDALGLGTGSLLYMNALGDIVFDDGGFWKEGIDQRTLPTPEPSSLLLLGTAVAAGAGLVRRRLAA